MSWLFSRVLVEEFLEDISLDGGPSVPLRLTDSPHKFLHNGKMMDISRHSRFGLTCQLLTASHGEALLTLFRADSHARTSQAREKGEALQAPALASGNTWPASLEKCSQPMLSLKIPLSLLSAASALSSTILPKWGSMQNGEFWGQDTSEPHIAGTASGSLLPTPSGCRSGTNHVAGRLDEWGGSSNPWRGTNIGKTHSPAFEEWIMGWPVQWTVPMPLEMARFRQWQHSHGILCQNKH